MIWIAEIFEKKRDEIISDTVRSISASYGENPSPVLSEDIFKSVASTLSLLVSCLSGSPPATLFEKWENIGSTAARLEYSIADIPDVPGHLRKSIWRVVAKEGERQGVGFSDIAESMMSVESILDQCRTSMLEGYFSSRDMEFVAKSARMESLFSLASVLSNENDLGIVCETVAETMAEICGLARCTLLRKESGNVIPKCSNFSDSISRLASACPESLATLLERVSEGDPVVINDYTESDPGILDLLRAYGSPSLLVVPFGSGEKILGAALLDDRRRGEFSREKIQLAKVVADHTAPIIERHEIIEAMETKVKQLAAINIIAKTLAEQLDFDEQLETISEIALTLTHGSAVFIFLPEEMIEDLRLACEFGARGKTDAESIRNLALFVFNNCKAVVCGRDRSASLPPELAQKDVFCLAAPLLIRDRPAGVIVVTRDFDKAPFSAEDLETFKNFASQAAVAIENTRLYERLQNTYLGIIASLAAAIEARDPYTVGHSARVTKYAMAIAEAMNLSSEEIEEIRLAGLLHDLGKIGIPDHVLNKPDSLTEDEYSLIKTHPTLSTRIIEPLPHLGGVMPIIYNHHERYNGKGYVEGKAGKEIPVGARIIAVADAFEAMTSDRPYRPALSREEAIEELRRCAGTQFDPEIVDIFVSLLEKTARAEFE